jgi:ABC-type multidrug transport system fused ATPase/permease subunit
MVAIIVVLRIAQSLVPPLTAVVTGALVASLLPNDDRGLLLVDAALPFLAFIVLLLAGHCVDVAAEPLSFRARSKVDGAHRRRIAGWCAGTRTIVPLEDPHIRDLLRQASAEPENWTERTPGAGALAQLTVLARYVGLVASCVVLGTYALWFVPALTVPALIGRALRRRQWLSSTRQWVAGTTEGRRAAYWREVLTRAGEAKEVRIFGFAEWAIGRMEGHTLAMYLPVWRRQAAIALQQALPFLLAALPLSVVFAVAVAGSAGGHHTVAAAAAVLAAGTSLYQIMSGTNDVVDIEGALPAIRARRELGSLLAGGDARPVTLASPPASAGPPLVTYDNVSFAYPGMSKPVLEGLNLDIRPGELLAVVGLNGAGKSTLIKLLAGLYEPDAGRITVDGVDLRDVDPAAWRRTLSVVFQDSVKYHLPLRDNVVLGRADLPIRSAAIEAATAESGAARLVDRLPAGWQTPLARTRSGGVDLSGGEWQQVILTRALYAVEIGARVLILDEPTAHLDVRTEFELFQRLARKAGEVSVVLISHRLSTVRRADRIVVLDRGRITATGTHEELVRSKGSYAAMFEIQARRFNAEDPRDAIDAGCP